MEYDRLNRNSVEYIQHLGPVYKEEGAPPNRATRLEGLKHSPPLHATHLTETVSGLRELSLERQLSTTTITADQGIFFHLISASCTGPVSA